MTPAALEIDSLSFSVKGKRILKAVSTRVETGQFWSVIGANGAGKSTLLKCILRIYNDWRGEVRLFGRSLREYSQRDLAGRLAYVPQPGGDQRFPFTVRQFVSMGRYPYSGVFGGSHPDDEAVVQKAMERAQVTSFAERKLQTLSGGERQKVFIAAALAQEGELLLLDEPTAFLDYRHQAEVSRILREIVRDRRSTIVSVTHDVNTAIMAGGKVLALRDGEVAWAGPAEALSRPGRLETIFNTPFRFIEDPVTGHRLVAPREVE